MPASLFNIGPLHEMTSWKITLALIVAMLVTAEVGFRFGRSRQPRIGDLARGHFTAIQASLLGLLALLLGFTFNMANVRFDARRQGVIDAANNLAAIGLRSEELAPIQRTEFQRLLREFLGQQADAEAMKRGITPGELAVRSAHSQALYRQMWAIVRSEAEKPNPPRVIETLAGQLIEAQSLLRRRIYAYLNRVPDPILFLLFIAATGAACVVGYSAGLGQTRGRFQIVALTVLVCGTINVILQLDRPLSGVQVDQTPLLQLREQWEQEAKNQ